jgi:histidine triad (HIT) family protein
VSDCIFCRIVAGEIPAQIVWQDDDVFAFRDAAPRAPVHVLVVPRRHVPSVLGLSKRAEDVALGGRLLTAAIDVARQEGLGEPGRGFRLVVNTGPEGGQSVDHIHVHILGGRALAWPPG